MINIFLVFDDQQLLDYYESLCSSLGDIYLEKASSGQEAIQNYSRKGFNLIVTSYETKESGDLLAFLDSQPKSVPTLLTCFTENYPDAKRKFKTKTLLHYFQHGDDLESLTSTLSQMIKLNQRSLQKVDYCKVNLNFFNSITEVFCDVYLKINNHKYIKVLNRYENVDHHELQKFKDRQVEYLFVKSRDFQLVTKRLLQRMKQQQEAENLLPISSSSQAGAIIPIQLQELVSESIQKLGLNAEAIEMTSHAINSTMDLIEKDQEVIDFHGTYDEYLANQKAAEKAAKS